MVEKASCLEILTNYEKSIQQLGQFEMMLYIPVNNFSVISGYFTGLIKKWIWFWECSWNHEYFRSEAQRLQINFANNPKYSWFHEQTNKWIYCLYLHFIKNI